MDAIAYSKSVLGEGFPWVFVLPGIAATLALLFMNLISREELAEMTDDAYDEGSAVSHPLLIENPWCCLCSACLLTSFIFGEAKLLHSTEEKACGQIGCSQKQCH